MIENCHQSQSAWTFVSVLIFSKNSQFWFMSSFITFFSFSFSILHILLNHFFAVTVFMFHYCGFWFPNHLTAAVTWEKAVKSTFGASGLARVSVDENMSIKCSRWTRRWGWGHWCRSWRPDPWQHPGLGEWLAQHCRHGSYPASRRALTPQTRRHPRPELRIFRGRYCDAATPHGKSMDQNDRKICSDWQTLTIFMFQNFLIKCLQISVA